MAGKWSGVYSANPLPDCVREPKGARLMRLEEEAAAAAAQEAAIAPIIAKLDKGYQKLLGRVIEQVKTGKDESFVVPADAANLSLRRSEVEPHNIAVARQFMALPEWKNWDNKSNFSAITEYMSRQGLQIFTLETMKMSFRRLVALHLLEEQDVESEVIEQQEQAAQAERASAAEQQRAEREADLIEENSGWNLVTGARETLTTRQIDAMSADQFKRFKRLCGANAPTLTNLFRK